MRVLRSPSTARSTTRKRSTHTLARTVADAETLPEAAHALAAEIADRTGETTAIGALAGTFVIFLDVIESTQSVRYFAQVGDRVPVYASSVGRAILAQLSHEERRAIYRKIKFEGFQRRPR
ncbi:MAG: IclR family transcriptional regulator C-terminal domain-containing protein [Xanthobacteraceae bacterium]